MAGDYYVEPNRYPDGSERSGTGADRHTIALKIDQGSNALPGQENFANPVYLYCYQDAAGASPTAQARPCALLTKTEVEAVIGATTGEPSETTVGNPYCSWSSPGQQVRIDLRKEQVDAAAFEAGRQEFTRSDPSQEAGVGERVDGVGDAAYWRRREVSGDGTYSTADIEVLAGRQPFRVLVRPTNPDLSATQEAALKLARLVVQRLAK